MTLGQNRFDPRLIAGLAVLTVVLAAQGVAVSESVKWAAPLACLLVIALAVEVPIVPALGGFLLVRVLIDQGASEGGRGGSSLPALIGGLLILLAVGLLLRRRRGLATIVGIALAIGFWTGIAGLGQGIDSQVLREGVRELSILAVAAIVLNSRDSFTMPVAARIVQVAGILAALLAIEQLAGGGGMFIGGEFRANGTFGHPNAAAIYFGVAAVTSLWRYLECGRTRLDLAFLATFVLAALATVSIDGFTSLLVMMLTFGLVRPGSRKVKVRMLLVVGGLIAAFIVSPIGGDRIASQTEAIGSEEAGRHGSSSSLLWRFYRWEELIPEWERRPILGKGLGTTTTLEATAANTTVGNLPHNEYVRYLVETGIVGLGILLAGLAWLLRTLNRARKRALPEAAGAAVLGIAVTVGLMFNGLAANTLLYTPTAFAAALLIATALRGSREAATARAPRGAGDPTRSHVPIPAAA